eukprot:6309170-Prymnesium_polylepis.1
MHTGQCAPRLENNTARVGHVGLLRAQLHTPTSSAKYFRWSPTESHSHLESAPGRSGGHGGHGGWVAVSPRWGENREPRTSSEQGAQGHGDWS